MIREFKKPDLNAPRCRSGAPKIINLNFLKEFVEKYPQYKDLSIEQAHQILRIFHGKLWDHALKNRDGIELPEGLGFVFLGTCFPAKKYNADYGNFIKNNIRSRHKNFESDNYLAKIFYTNFANKYKFKNRELWSFTAIRDFKRGVAPIYRENWKIYVQVENGKNISKYMKKIKKIEYIKKIGETYKVSSSYNEFDLN